MADLVVRIRELEDGAKDYRFALTHLWLTAALQGTELQVPPDAPEGEVDMRIEQVSHEILLRGEVRAQLLVPCIRCLEDVRLSLATPCVALLTPRSAIAEELELTPEDLDRDTYSGDRIELDALVRESLLLAVPLQPLCAESCPGIPIPAHVRPPADFGGR